MPPTGGGVGVGACVGDAGVAAALALALGEVVPAPGLAVGLVLGVGEAEEQAVLMIPTRATSATRRNGIGGEFRPSASNGARCPARCALRSERGGRPSGCPSGDVVRNGTSQECTQSIREFRWPLPLRHE